MPHKILTQYGHIAIALPSAADAFAGTVRTDVFNIKNYTGCEFIIEKGAGASGTSVITVSACDNTTPSNRTAIPFRYRACTSGDTWGAVTTATASGFTTTAGANQLYEIIVDASEVAKANCSYVEMTAVESVDSAVNGSVLWIGHEANQPQDIPATVLV